MHPLHHHIDALHGSRSIEGSSTVLRMINLTEELERLRNMVATMAIEKKKMAQRHERSLQRERERKGKGTSGSKSKIASLN